jgi:hypothetical protein
MRRRDFITLLGGAVAWPLAARAQQAPVIGLLSSGSPDPDGPALRSFRQGLMQAGFVEDRNVRFEYRWAANELDRLPELAADLVSRKVSVIFAVGGPSPALAAILDPHRLLLWSRSRRLPPGLEIDDAGAEPRKASSGAADRHTQCCPVPAWRSEVFIMALPKRDCGAD